MKTVVEFKTGISDKNKELCEKYWLREKDNKTSYLFTCQSLGEVYELKRSEITDIVRDNACLKVLDCLCLDCGTSGECKTRFELTNLEVSNWRCDMCLKAYEERREKEWNEHLLEQLRLQQERQEAIMDSFNWHREQQERSVLPIEELGVIEKLLLTAVVESLSSENLKSTISLTESLERPLSPLHTMDETILKHLFEANVLLLDPIDGLEYESIAGIDYSRATFDFAYDIRDITRLRTEVRGREVISKLADNVVFKDWCESIQLAECVSYLIERAGVNKLEPPLGEKMLSLLQSSLYSCSVAEVTSLIWMSVESASSYSNKPNITKKRASNSIYTILQTNTDRVLNGIWKRKPFNRDINLPKSAIAKVFFDDVFKVSDGSFKYRLDELLESLRAESSPKEGGYLTLGGAQEACKNLTLQLKIG